MVQSLKSDKRIDLFEYMVNKDTPNGPNRYWCAGDQLEALRYYLKTEVVFLSEYKEDDWQGECFAIFMVEGIFVCWRDWFGSCSGCDALEDEDGYKYIKQTLTEGNTLQFETLDDMEAFMKEEEDYLWTDMPMGMFDRAREKIRK